MATNVTEVPAGADGQPQEPLWLDEMTPRQFVAELDKYIVGQQAAKKAVAIGSGGSYALAAARALKDHSGLSAPDIVRRALEIAGDICIYTNKNITVLELDGPAPAAEREA